MGTRAGQIDPGVLLYLQRHKGMSLEKVEYLLHYESGLKGVSAISSNMRELLDSSEERAVLAVELFCYQAARHVASLIPSIGGIDAVVFTGGIGEGSAVIRAKILDYLAWLNLVVDEEKNTKGAGAIYTNSSAVEIYVIPTNEELMIAQHTKNLLEEQ
jgi:acetate kinase